MMTGVIEMIGVMVVMDVCVATDGDCGEYGGDDNVRGGGDSRR